MIGRRISVVGASGSGKSHVSHILAELLQLQVHELDEIRDRLQAGQLKASEFAGHVEALVRRDEWIIDGHYVAIRHLIWQRADTVIFINYPLYVVFIQVVNRYLGKKWRHLNRNGGTLRASGSRVGAKSVGLWRQRWGRLLKTFRERQDYGRTLRQPEYDKLIVIELKSRSSTRDWLQAIQVSNIELKSPLERPDYGAANGAPSEPDVKLPPFEARDRIGACGQAPSAQSRQ